jgi:branched-chain amino acid transport system ATP-binding protein
VLKTENLSVHYGPVEALNEVNIEIGEGEIVALIGANGAGKSTVLETVLGLHRATSGRIMFLGEDITRKPTDRIVASGLCLAPEGRGILPLMTVLENLQIGAFHLKGKVDEYLAHVFERFPRLQQRSKQMAGTLSGGEQQMLSLARGLMSAPKLLMLDEPSLGLAPVVVEDLFRIIVELNREGQTILLSEQNAHKALECAHHGYVFETGTITVSGTPLELASDTRVSAAYLGG